MDKMGEDTETAFRRHQAIVPQVKQAYKDVIEQIFADLSPSDLDSCAAILEEHEASSLDTEQMVNTARKVMTKIVLDVNECFFAGNDVDTKLTTLEMLKEHFAPHKGKKWNFNSVSPEELTRPLRMNSLDLSIRFMERQLKSQEKELEIAMAKSVENRQRIQDVQVERVKVGHLIKERMAQYQEMKPQLTEIERSLNNLHMPPKA
ncbi:uncharacterized protein LOC108029003 [Drosophila biarmipes]|uniref:uncharacterized protein LOC108029003 n=1 Tax=Drosophila biarmipes TaxID=125945 RepID=UPI0007E8754A|nr:uncharacterized protein LOC108029003 [Drosophila biarmipes]